NDECEWNSGSRGSSVIRGTLPIASFVLTSLHHFGVAGTGIFFTGHLCVELICVEDIRPARFVLFFSKAVIHGAELEYVREGLKRQFIDKADAPKFLSNEGVIGEYIHPNSGTTKHEE
ncbi:hypothetical protein EV363DRAFT_1162357, partial [Boletus edulis]